MHPALAVGIGYFGTVGYRQSCWLYVQVIMAESMPEATDQFRVAAGQSQLRFAGFLQFLCAVGRVQFRQAPQATPDATGWAAFQQDAAFVIFQDQHPGGLFRFLFLRLGARVEFGFVSGIGLAAVVHRATFTGGFAAGAHHGAQVHDALGVVAHALIRRVLLGMLPELFQYRGLPRPAGYSVVTGQNAFYVAVQNGGLLAESLGNNGRSGGAADAGQGFQCFLVLRELAVMLVRHLPRCLVQVTGAGVVTQARPVAEYVDRKSVV